MIISCEECKTRFNLDETLLSKTGSKVRCCVCKNIFIAYPEVLIESISPDDTGPEKTEKSDPDAEEKKQSKNGVDEETESSQAGKKLNAESENKPLIEPDHAENSKEKLDENRLTQLLEKQKETYDDPEFSESATVLEVPESVSPKKKMRKPIIMLAILAILAGGIYATYRILEHMNIKTPYVSDFLKPQAAKEDDPGASNINIFDIDNRFVENRFAGKIFVIAGKVKNDYPEPRSHIKVNGKLFTTGRTFLKQKSVSCGNMISDYDLANMNRDALNRLMNNPPGQENSNINVLPGTMIPFMIVFFETPANLDEYVVKPESSSKNNSNE
jgi:predicted Zn finger-like uncharacterized protein